MKGADMSDSDKLFTGSIPEIYDTYLVPLIFESFAADLAQRVADGPSADVLETAAGSGVVTRALAALLAEDARYSVTDLNQPMLDRAKQQQKPDTRISWQQADALNLPFGDDGFDVVCCQFGAMFFPDRPAGYREARRVLKPGGRLIFNVWDRIEENEFADIVTKSASEVFPDAPPLFLARTPHGYHDTRQIAADVKAAGFGTVDIQTLTKRSHAATAANPAIAYCKGTPLRNEIVSRDPDALEEVTQRATRAIEDAFGTGPVSGKIQGIVITATA